MICTLCKNPTTDYIHLASYGPLCRDECLAWMMEWLERRNT